MQICYLNSITDAASPNDFKQLFDNSIINYNV